MGTLKNTEIYWHLLIINYQCPKGVQLQLQFTQPYFTSNGGGNVNRGTRIKMPLNMSELHHNLTLSYYRRLFQHVQSFHILDHWFLKGGLQSQKITIFPCNFTVSSCHSFKINATFYKLQILFTFSPLSFSLCCDLVWVILCMGNVSSCGHTLWLGLCTDKKGITYPLTLQQSDSAWN